MPQHPAGVQLPLIPAFLGGPVSLRAVTQEHVAGCAFVWEGNGSKSMVPFPMVQPRTCYYPACHSPSKPHRDSRGKIQICPDDLDLCTVSVQCELSEAHDTRGSDLTSVWSRALDYLYIGPFITASSMIYLKKKPHCTRKIDCANTLASSPGFHSTRNVDLRSTRETLHKDPADPRRSGQVADLAVWDVIRTLCAYSPGMKTLFDLLSLACGGEGQSAWVSACSYIFFPCGDYCWFWHVESAGILHLSGQKI